MIDNDEWEVRSQVKQLSKAGEHDRAIELGESALAQRPGFAPLATILGWAHYRRDLSGVDDQKDLPARRRAKAALDRIVELTEDDPYNKYSPLANAALKFASVLAKRWPRAALDVLSILSPDRLDSEKDGEFESPQARWVMIRTKALEAAGEWSELLSACDGALADPLFDGKHRRWVTLRRCEALRHTGRTEEAEPILRAEAEESGDWWLFERLAQVYESLDRHDAAVAMAFRALNAAGKVTSFQWRVVFSLARLLEEQDPKLAAEHARLARVLRRDEGWPADGELESLCARLEMGDDDDRPAKDLIAVLIEVWSRVDDSERETGCVDRHLNEGSGLIKPDSGGDLIYFARPRNSSTPLPEIGARVSYLVTKGFDKKRNRESLQAAKWREIEHGT